MATESAPVGRASAVPDEHSVMLWQTCAYAAELTDAAHRGHSVTVPYLAMVGFAHQRLLPYLSEEEHSFPPTRLRDEHMARLLSSDHARLRADVDNIEGARTQRLLVLATEALVEHLDRHVQREEAWIRPDRAAQLLGLAGPDTGRTVRIGGAPDERAL